jgi:hypothetical protein
VLNGPLLSVAGMVSVENVEVDVRGEWVRRKGQQR